MIINNGFLIMLDFYLISCIVAIIVAINELDNMDDFGNRSTKYKNRGYAIGRFVKDSTYDARFGIPADEKMGTE